MFEIYSTNPLSHVVVPGLGLLPVLLVLVAVLVIVTRYTTSWSWYQILTVATLFLVVAAPFAYNVEITHRVIAGPQFDHEPSLNPNEETQLQLWKTEIKLNQSELEKELEIGFYNDDNKSRLLDPELTDCKNRSNSMVPYFTVKESSSLFEKLWSEFETFRSEPGVEPNEAEKEEVQIRAEEEAVGQGPFLCELSVHEASRDLIIRIMET